MLSRSLRITGVTFALVSLATLAGGCVADQAPEEPVAETSNELVFLAAVPVVALTASEAIGLTLIATGLFIGGLQLNTYVEPRYRDDVTPQLRSAVEMENDFLEAKYAGRLFATSTLTANRWVSAFGYPTSMVNASRSLVRTARDSEHRNKPGCVIASVKGAGARFTGAAPFRSEHEVIAAQFVAASRAYLRCGAADAEVREAWMQFIPQDSLPSVDASTFIDHSVKTVQLLNALRSSCRDLTFSVSLDTSRCR